MNLSNRMFLPGYLAYPAHVAMAAIARNSAPLDPVLLLSPGRAERPDQRVVYRRAT